MNRVVFLALVSLVFVGSLPFVGAIFAENKPAPNQASNEQVALAGTVMLDRVEIRDALGTDLGTGYAVVRITVTPKTDEALRVSPDDFTLLSRKDGDRGGALTPAQIAGNGGALIVKPAARQPGGDGTRTNGPIWGGVTVRASDKKATNPEDSPLLNALKEKMLPDGETKTPVEGLLYFAMGGKLKPKDLSLLYKGSSGHLVIDFK
ncbi:MAG TPA: hypothetical protein VIY49_13890 [Bryobacteraceae bacterium]